MAFNVDAALKDGYSEQEIAEYLGKQNKFNASAALKDGYSAKEIIDHLNKPTETGIIGQIGRGIAAYPSQTQETVGGGQALLGKALLRIAGENPVSSYLLNQGLANVQEAEKEQKAEAEPSDSFTDAWHKGLGTVLGKYLPYQIGQGLANAAETLAVTGVGTLVGAATPIPGGAEAGAVGSFIGKRLVQSGIKEAAKKVFDETLEREGKAAAKEAAAKFVAEQGAKTLTKEEGKALARQGAKSVGANAAIAAQAIGHGVGEVGSRAVENAKTPEEINMAKALPAAAVHAAADFIASKIGLSGLHGMSKSTENWLLDVGKNWLLTGTKELPPELLQTAMERFGASLPLADKNAVKDYINTVAGSYGMTAGPGVIGGTRTRLSANQAQVEEEEAPPQKEKEEKPVLPITPATTPTPTPTSTTKVAPLPSDTQAEVEKEMTQHGHTRENAEMIVRQRLREEQEATNVGQTIPPAGGVSTGVPSGAPAVNAAPTGAGALAGNGVVSTEPNVGLPNAGEGQASTAVKETPEQIAKRNELLSKENMFMDEEPEGYAGPNPKAPDDANSWQNKNGSIHYNINAFLENGKSKVTELIDQEQSKNIALVFEDSQGNKGKIINVGFTRTGMPYWSAGDVSEQDIKTNLGENLFNSLGNAPIKNTTEYGALVDRIKNALLNKPTKKEEPSVAEAPAKQPVKETPVIVEPTLDEDIATQKKLLGALDTARNKLLKNENLASGDPRIDAAKAAVEKAQNEYDAFVAESQPRRTKSIEELTKVKETPTETKTTTIAPTLEERIKAEDERNAAFEAKIAKVESIARVNANVAFDQVGDYPSLQEAIDSHETNVMDTLHEEGFTNDPDYSYLSHAASRAFDAEVEKLKGKQVGTETPETKQATQEEQTAPDTESDIVDETDAEANAAAATENEATSAATPIKRSRGRPKSTTPKTTLEKPKGKRGRPVKTEEQTNVDTAIADLNKALKPFDDSNYETDEEVTAAEREHRINRVQAIKNVMRLGDDPKAKAALENPAITAKEKADIGQGIKIEDERASRSDIHYTDKSSDKVNNGFRRAKTGSQAIREIIKTGNAVQRFFARRIQNYLKGVKFVVIEKGDVLPAQLTSAKNAPHWERAKGLYIENLVTGTRTVYVRGSSFGADQGVNNTTVLHELLHAALNRKLDMALDAIHGNHSLNSPLVKAYVDLVKVMDNAGRHFNDLARQGKLPAKIAALARHGGIFSDPKEFVAYGLTDEDMQEFLHGAMGFEEDTSFFTQFVNTVRRFFGMDEDSINALSDLIVISDKLLTAKKTPQMRAQAKQQAADIIAKKKANMTATDEKVSAAAKNKAAKVSATEKKIAISDRAQDIVENMGILGMLRDPQLFFDTFGRNGSAWTALNTTKLKAILPALQTSVVVEWAHNLGINHMKQTERLMQDMSSMRAKSMVTASEIVTDWAKLSGGIFGKLRGKKNELRDISNVMHAATDKGIDPDTNINDKELNTRWNKLSEPAKEIYRKVRNFYESNYNLYRALLDTRIGNLNIDDKDRDKIMAEIKKMYELGKRITPYFPLMRYGQYWVGVGQHKGRQFHMFESEIDRENFIKAEVRRLNKEGDTRTLEEMLKDEQITSGNDLKGLREKSVTAESSALLKKIFTLVDDSKGDLGNAIQAEALKDQIYQLYLTTMPEQNFRKQFVHRKGTAGFSGDALRNFINSSLNMANQMSRLKYAPQLLGEIDMAKESLKGNPEAAKLGMFIDELGERVKMEVNPKIESPFANNVANVANKYAFLYYMTSVKTALVQLASLPVFGAPVLFARHNPGDVVREMTKSLNIFNELGVLKDGKFTMPTMTTSKRVKANPEEKLAIEAMVERGISEVTMTYDLMDRKATPSENYTGAWNKTTRAMGALFHHAERLNREVMFMTSFRLSRKAGVPIDEAIEQAVSDTYTALGNFTAQERPRIMRSPVGRTLLQFKMFPAFVTTYYARNFYRMFANEDPKVKKEAATMFFGSLAMSGLLAGYVGIPGIDMAMGVVQGVINAMRSDDDDDELEKRDLSLWFRTVFMHNFFGDIKIGGKNLGDIVDEGLLNYLTGTDIAGSMSMNNIWFQDIKEQKTMQSTMQDYALGMMGPTAGFFFKQFPAAIDNWSQGKYMQGFEKILPSLFRNPVTAYRYSQEGAKSASGLPIKEPEEFTKGQLIAQALGFRTTGLAQVQEVNFKAEALRQQVLQKRAEVISRADLEATRGDDEALDKAIDAIVKFNSKNPTEAIKAKQLSKSLLDRAKARQASDRGFRVEKKLYPYLQDLLEPSRQQLERESAKP